jgi:competence protein ComEC
MQIMSAEEATMRKAFLLMVAFVALSGAVRAQGNKPLDVYFIDVEGGQSTLFITPAGESVLVDSGNPGGRDPGRIIATIKQAGLTQIDYMVVTHFDADHVGGVSEISQQIPIRNFVDHGPREPIEGVTLSANAKAVDDAYAAARAKGHYMQTKAGDKIPIKGMDWYVVSSQNKMITKPLPGAGAPNPACKDYVDQPMITSDDRNSLGVIIALGRFRMSDFGDLPWHNEHELVCPNNLVGMVDVYLTTAHGLALSSPPASVHAMRPRVTIINNGPRKGDAKETWLTLKSSPGMEDIWQLHYSVARAPTPTLHELLEPGGPDLNAPEQFIANMAQDAAHAEVYALKLSARPDGSFTVANLRNGFKKEYGAR